MRRPPLNLAGVYAIVDLPYPHPIAPAEIAAALIDGGVTTLQLRAKRADARQIRAWLTAIAEPCLAAGVPVIVNDEIALAELGLPGVVGVHLGQGDLDRLGADPVEQRDRREQLRGRGLVLGVSTHSLGQVHAAVDALAPDYLGFGPVFPTTSKHDSDPVVGIDRLREVCAQSPVPVVAIGGIDGERAKQLGSTGVAAIAAIGALVGATPVAIRTQAVALVQAFRVDS
jgi:thiamine-phosphate pyrophosphorylase